jgi:hypothetical protein
VRLLAALLSCGCIGTVTPSQCAADSDCAAAEVCLTGACIPGSREADGGVCPQLHPSWTEINQRLFQVGCGTRLGSCHSAAGAAEWNGLPLGGDPYARLVNAASYDGGFTLVKPGDPDQSYLYIKLHLTSSFDPVYGAGMPPDEPGQTCASAQEAVRQWIANGAVHD